MIDHYLLSKENAVKFFNENLSGVNKLSDLILSYIKTNPGSFYAILPQKTPLNRIDQLNTGGITKCLRKEVSEWISDILNDNINLNCIFDDFNSDLNSIENSEFYNSHGINFENEIYYLLQKKTDINHIWQCLNYSSTIWHSLSIIFTTFPDKPEGKSVNECYFRKICGNARFVILEAYDAESYIYWIPSAIHHTS